MDTDRNLLFGVLALQADVISQARFVEACKLWAKDKDVPFADLLLNQGWINAEDRGHIEYLLERKRAKYDGDARSGLAEAWVTWLTWASSATATDARKMFAGLADADIEQALGLKSPVLLSAHPRRRRRMLPAALILLTAAVVALTIITGLLQQARMRTQRQRDLAQENFEAARKDVADAYRRIGEITREIGANADAQKALTKAAELFEQLRMETPDDPEILAGLARTYVALAQVHVLGKQAAIGGETGKKAINLLEPLWDTHGEMTEYGRLLGRSYDLVGVSHAMQARHAEAAPFFQKAIATLEQSPPADLEAKKLLGQAYEHLAETLARTGPWPEYEKAARQAIVILGQLIEKDPVNVRLRVELARGLGNLGLSECRMGRLTPAQADLQKCFDLLRKLVDENPGVDEHRALFAKACASLGETRRAQGQTAEAEKELRKALAILEELNRKEPINEQRLQDLAWVLYQIATLQGEKGDAVAALATCERAHDIHERLVKNHPKQPSFLLAELFTREGMQLLEVQADQSPPGDLVLAQLQVAREREELAEKTPDQHQWQYAAALGYVRAAELQRRAGQFGTAVPSLGKAVAILEKLQQAQPEHYECRRLLAEALAERSRAKWRLGAAEDSRQGARQAVALLEKLVQDEPAYRYDLARHRTWCAFTLGLGRKPLKPEDGVEADYLANAAVEDLRQAIKNGFDNLHQLETDDALEPLRERPDFGKLLEELRARATSKPQLGSRKSLAHQVLCFAADDRRGNSVFFLPPR